MHNAYLGIRKRKPLLAVFNNEPKDSTPKTLYKKAFLLWDSSAEALTLSPLAFPEGTSFNAAAECRSSYHRSNPLTRFEVPSKACSCGFYAYTDEDDARDHTQAGPDSFILKVVASGKMLEYKKGYRYGHQRVEEVIVYSCYGCDKSADRVILLERTSIVPVCKSHARIVRPIYRLSFKEMGELASRSLPTHAPRIKFRSANEEVKPWISEMDIKRISGERVGFGDVMYEIVKSPMLMIPFFMGVVPISVSALGGLFY